MFKLTKLAQAIAIAIYHPDFMYSVDRKQDASATG